MSHMQAPGFTLAKTLIILMAVVVFLSIVAVDILNPISLIETEEVCEHIGTATVASFCLDDRYVGIVMNTGRNKGIMESFAVPVRIAVVPEKYGGMNRTLSVAHPVMIHKAGKLMVGDSVDLFHVYYRGSGKEGSPAKQTIRIEARPVSTFVGPPLPAAQE